MLENCLGIISFEDTGNKFGTLCRGGPAYMLPFAGRYKLVDFTLSNMINYGLSTIAVFTGENIQPILNHLGDGKPWGLNRKTGGLSIFPPLFDYRRRFGDIYQYHIAMDFFVNPDAKYVLIANPNILSKVNLTEVFEHFLNTGADITVVYKRQDNGSDDYENIDNLIIDDDGRFVNIGMNLGLEPQFNLLMDMYLIRKEVFLQIISIGMESGEDLYFKQAMVKYKNMYDINSYEFGGHVECIRGIRSYYNANMNMLNDRIFDEIFSKGGTILTRPKDEPSVLYVSKPEVKNSLIANGCIIEGRVENSVLFRAVRVEKNAVVKNSILMEGVVVQENAKLINAIPDRYAVVGKGVDIVGIKNNPFLCHPETGSMEGAHEGFR